MLADKIESSDKINNFLTNSAFSTLCPMEWKTPTPVEIDIQNKTIYRSLTRCMELYKYARYCIQLFQLRLSPEHGGKVEYERERLLGITNKFVHL
jgi:hypothetical protein